MVVIDEKLCTGCGLCAADCVVQNIEIKDGKAQVLGECMRCGHCTAICPSDAPAIPEYRMDEVEEYSPDKFLIAPDNFLRAVKFRRSIRRFREQAIEKDKLERVLSAGCYTETAVNYQDVRFILVQDELEHVKKLTWQGWLTYADALEGTNPDQSKNIRKFYDIYQKNPKEDRLFFNAPALLVIASDIPLDGGMASANIEMMAVAEGLGVLYDGYIVYALNHSQEALDWLGTGNKNIAACMLLGYPDVTYQRTAPRRAGDIIWK